MDLVLVVDQNAVSQKEKLEDVPFQLWKQTIV